MRLLIIEDTQEIWAGMEAYLSASGYDCVWVTTIQDAYTVFQNQHIDCAIIDRMLPDGEGIQACNEIKSYRDIPVIIATAKSQLEDKVQWFAHGADDYLTKPFDLKELELRIQAVTKRNSLHEMMYRKDITIDLEKKEIYRKDKLVWLTNKEFLIIALLLTNHGKIISRTDFMEEVRWGKSIRENDNKLDVYISTIRKKLGKEFIQTVKGVGYRITI